MKIELSAALQSFQNWMNRPIKRVQVYTWQIACNLFNREPLANFRCLPKYRDEKAKIARKEVAQMIKFKRSIKSIVLPKYNEKRGEYV